MSTHTPGPWFVKVNPIWHAVRSYNSDYVAEHIRGASDAQRAANARLIAAAPDLLEALKRAVKVIHELSDYDPKGGNDLDYADFTQAAIAKAEGRQP